MDWLGQLPMAQIVRCSSSWLRRPDPRKLWLDRPPWSRRFWLPSRIALWLAWLGSTRGSAVLPGRCGANLPCLLALSLLVAAPPVLATRACAAPDHRRRRADAAPQSCWPDPQPTPGEKPAWNCFVWGPVQLGPPCQAGALWVGPTAASPNWASTAHPALFTLIHSAKPRGWTASLLEESGLGPEPGDQHPCACGPGAGIVSGSPLLALALLPVQEEFQNLSFAGHPRP